MTSPVSILTGGPGTGKTFTTRTIVEVWRELGYRVKLACPTARAAHRLNGVRTDVSHRNTHALTHTHSSMY